MLRRNCGEDDWHVDFSMGSGGDKLASTGSDHGQSSGADSCQHPAFNASEGERCPRCGYNRQGLEAETCPECGIHLFTGNVVRQLAETLATKPLHVPSGPLRCAVCSEEIADGTARRCPRCGSRYIRLGENRTGQGAGGTQLATLPGPPPPMARPPRRDRFTRWAPAAAWMSLFLSTLLVMLTYSPFITLTNSPWIGLVAFVIGGISFLMFIREANATQDVEIRMMRDPRMAQCCPRCLYPHAPGALGRCGECGQLLPGSRTESTQRCPACKYDLTHFRGDRCPECAHDVRTICDAAEME